MKKLEKYWIWPLVVAHLTKFLYWFRHLEFSSPYPIINYDFIQYYARILRSHEFMSESGRIWGYDPFQMAGYVSGPFLAVGTYFLSLTTYILSPIMSVPKSLLLIQCLGYIALPFSIVVFIRALGGTRNQSWVGFGLTLLLFGHMEQLTLQLIHVGLWGYQMAAFCSFLQVAFLLRWLKTNNNRDAFSLIFISSILFWFHPAALLIIIVPNTVLFVFYRSQFQLKQYGVIVGGMAIVFLSNYFWIKPFLAFSHFMDTAPYFISGGFKQLYYLLGPIQASWFYFIRMIFSWALIILAGQQIRFLLKTNPRLGRMLAIWIGWLFLVGYFGSHFPIISNLQPSRIVVALWVLIGSLSSFRLLEKIWKKKKQRELVIGLIVLILLVAFNRPKLGWSYLHNQLLPRQVKLVNYLKENGPKDSRVLISCADSDPAHISDLIPELTGVSIIGGPHPGNFIKGRSTLFTEIYWDGSILNFDKPMAFGSPLRNLTEEEFFNYLDLYNITLVLTNGGKSNSILQKWNKTLKSIGRVGGYSIFKVNRSSKWFVEGSGDISYDFDRIEIQNASNGILIPKFHWIKSLKTEPSVPIEPVFLSDDPLPFIKINNSEGHKTIKILNKGL